ncbi:hypothetical protein AS9A_P10023 (plasmid) [Hoyosella subflava DQS3-9A1]|uniref:Uncharacterized protein n=1 Tax=Hoyosella subflava (strain DSM 45089 / JCM 17490 / NBRC 109087 / DQS3-9A1) TaxID=443218 RepID=F6ESB9_HOYSD|nr:hypothetical protein AS9A_P10023 [Hoyosella subflava DQS3-9A1]
MLGVITRQRVPALPGTIHRRDLTSQIRIPITRVQHVQRHHDPHSNRHRPKNTQSANGV